jgi:hypothetical protein
MSEFKPLLSRMASDSDPVRAAVGLLREGFGFPLVEVSDRPVSLRDLAREGHREDWDNVINRTWLVGICGDEVFGEGVVDPNHDGIVFLLLDSENSSWEDGLGAVAPAITRAVNRAFPLHYVVLLFRHPCPRGPGLSFCICERTPYKVTHLEGEKAGAVSALKNIPLRQPLQEHEMVLEALNVNGLFLRRTRAFAKMMDRWRQVFTAGERVVLRESFRKYVLEKGEIPEIPDFRKTFGQFAVQSLLMHYPSYRAFLLQSLEGTGLHVDGFVVRHILSVYETFYKAFLYPPFQESICYMTQEENLPLVDRRELPLIQKQYESDFADIQKRYGRKHAESSQLQFEELAAEGDLMHKTLQLRKACRSFHREFSAHV